MFGSKKPKTIKTEDGEVVLGWTLDHPLLSELAAVLFLIGIDSRFPVREARYGLIAVATVLLVVSVVQLLGLPAPPS